MKTPKHWQSYNFLSALLMPLGLIYAIVTWVRLKLIQSQKVDIPVICVGNLTAGGSGKTPTAISLARLLKQAGKQPCFLSRGYGGKLQGIAVDRNRHLPAEVGDEPLLLANEAPVIVNHRRYEGACQALELGADVIIMDDGFQNPQLHKDKSLLVIDGTVGLGNILPIPAGPMREFLSCGLSRADGIILLGADKTNILPKLKGLPVFSGEVVPIKPKNVKPAVMAFAGIGRPQKLYQSLEGLGISLIKTKDFPDHHVYTRSELQKLIDEAAKLNADIFTTSKDMVKIPVDLRPYFRVLDIEVKWQDEAGLKQFLLK